MNSVACLGLYYLMGRFRERACHARNKGNNTDCDFVYVAGLG